MRLPESFFARDATLVARELLGTRLVRRLNGERLSGVIAEAEAYRQHDSACHAYRGMTKRNAVMFGAPGRAYVYFVYGLHHMLNVVAEPEGQAAAVLIRALEPQEGIETMQARRGGSKAGKLLSGGPARLTEALAIDRGLNGADLIHGEVLWIEAGNPIPEAEIARGVRIGIGYADEQDRLAPWRFWIRQSGYVSRLR
ncbi:MAG: DNA-3-methyladenine glycosylase [Chloroflexaceae bacterium]|nr:DNA-3-methyladenine glycosylase [Chloroflexaceae bacterium]